MRRTLIIILISFIAVTGCSERQGSIPINPDGKSDRFIEGVHYTRVKRLDESKDPQVIKFISFNCPACRFHESTSKLSVDESVTVERFPVSFSRESWQSSAKAYATLRTLNLHDEFSWPLFEAVQTTREPIGDKSYFAKWLSKRSGLTESDVLKAYDHDKTSELMALYKAAERRFAISSVPSIYVNGNIFINLQAMEGESKTQKMLFMNELIDHLIANHGKQ